MAIYKIFVSSSAERALKKVPKKDLVKIVSTIQSLARDPFPLSCRKLAGEEGAYRIRQGQYRIIYEVIRKMLIVRVLKVGHRKDVYQKR